MLLAVTFNVKDRGRAVISDVIGSAAEVAYVAGLDFAERREALERADVVLVINPAKELRPEEFSLLQGKRLIQFLSAGLDWVSLDQMPRDVPLASNAGAYATPMAEHVVAMALAAGKRLLIEHRNLARGEFNQFTTNKLLSGKVCGIFGFGGVGLAVARLMRCLGMRIQAVNRRGAAPEAPAGLLEWIGTTAGKDKLLEAADVLVVTAALTPSTRGIIGARELALMKSDAILVNVARGEIIDEAALYSHLRDHPAFTACIEAWWIEPVRHGQFRIHYPFFELPNVIGAPHNSTVVENSQEFGLRRAAENCRRALLGETPLHLIPDDERLPAAPNPLESAAPQAGTGQ